MLPPFKLFSQQRYFELGPKKLELSYFFHGYAIFSPSYTIFFFFPPATQENSVTGDLGEKDENIVNRGKK